MNNTVRIQNLENRMDSMESKLDKIIDLIGNTKSAPQKTSKKSSASKKSTEAKPQTKEERLTAKYGDLEVRKAFVELKNRYAKEFAELGKATNKYIPTKKYGEVLRMAAQTGKFTKKTAFELHSEYGRERK